MSMAPSPRRCCWNTFVLVTAVAAIVTTGSATDAATAAAAATCAKTGEPAPTVVTLMVSTKKPATEAWVVSPNCSIRVLSLDADGTLAVLNKLVDRVASVPSDALRITIDNSPLTREINLANAEKATIVDLESVSASVLDITLPPALETFNVLYTEFESMDNIKFPDTLLELSISTSKLSSMNNALLPAGLKTLGIEGCQITSLNDIPLPSKLQEISFHQNPITTLTRFSLPNTTVAFGCNECTISSVRGIKWPSSLQYLQFSGNTLTSFEVQQSDMAILRKLKEFAGDVKQTSCDDVKANLTAITAGKQAIKVCVVSDARFDSLYKSGGADSSGSGSKTLTSTGSGAGGSLTADAGSSRSDGNTNGSRSAGAGDSAQPNAASRKGTSSSKPPSADTTATSNTVVIVAIVFGVVCILAVGVVVYRSCSATKKSGKDDATATSGTTNEANTGDSPTTTANKQAAEPDWARLELLTDDFRNDKLLVRVRIEQKEIELGREIARGGHGVVYRATYQQRKVAVKQMAPNAWRNDKALAGFMDEIRICARLDHPKIVEFVGVAWSSLRDLTVVIEYMDGGDLHSLVHRYPECSGDAWSQSWTPARVRSKTLIAMDIAEAVVYLHSFNAPIIHRDLKAKNVLLDQAGNAKLSDFGISREMSIDETMTSEIGTAAWIAPEVLRGERYSEKADIYSLGVLMVELDRCSHPYANEPVLLMGSSAHRGGGGNDPTHVAHKNTQIVVMVSTGQLRPSASSACPATVATLIQRCVSFAAQDRPTALEVSYVLRQAQKASEAL